MVPLDLDSESESSGSVGVPNSLARVTIDDVIEELGFGWFQVRLVTIAGVMSFVDTMEMALVSYLGVAIGCVWEVNDTQIALITTVCEATYCLADLQVVFCGMALGAGLYGSLGDAFGRKRTLMLSNMLLFLSGFLSSFSPNFWFLLVTRFLVGLTISGAHNSVTLMVEYVPKYYRGTAFVSTQFFSALGACAEAVLAWSLLPNLGSYAWRIFFAASALPVLVYCLLLAFFIPESARFLLGVGDALSVLQGVARANGKEWKEEWNALGPMERNLNLNEKPTMPDEERTKSFQLGAVISAVKREYEAFDWKNAGLILLLRDGMWRTSLQVWALWFMTVFFYYGSVLLTVELVKLDERGLRCGNANKTLNASDSQMTLAGNTTKTCILSDSAFLEILIVSASEIPAVLIGWLLIDRLGRKRMALGAYLLMALCAYLFNACLPSLLARACQFVMRGASAIAFQAIYVYTPEVYPTTVRALGMGLASAVGRLGGIVTPFVSVTGLNHSSMGPSVVLTVYGSVALAAAVTSYLLPRETLGENLSEFAAKSAIHELKNGELVDFSSDGDSSTGEENSEATKRD